MASLQKDHHFVYFLVFFSHFYTLIFMSKMLTPMMKQYLEIKSRHEGFLLFYRMGDFYELFADDAIIASQILNITLTQRRSSKKEKGLPMCGVPHHAAEGYIAKLIQAGHKVALCDQMESPAEAKKREGSGALVRRDVVRMFTGGTLTEDTLLDAAQSNYVCTLAHVKDAFALAWLELSTGDIGVTHVTHITLIDELTRLNPAEIVLNERLLEKFSPSLSAYYITHNDPIFNPRAAKDAIKNAYNIGQTNSLRFASEAQQQAVGAVIGYAQLTQVGKLPQLKRPEIQQNQGFLHIDAASRQHLELFCTLKGEKKGSLIHAIDHTVSAAGGRLLKTWLSAPLVQLDVIQNRQASLQFFLDNTTICESLRATLKQTADVGRSVGRIMLGRGGPRDLNALRITLECLPDITNLLNAASFTTQQILLSTALKSFLGLEDLTLLLKNALKETDLPLLARDGGFIRQGFCTKLDDYNNLKQNGHTKLQELERSEAEKNGITSLKIKYNKVWGYFFEVTKTHANKVPDYFIHRQTTTNAQRFSTEALMTLEQDLSAAKTNALKREQELFESLVHEISQKAAKLHNAADSLAILDVTCAGAILAHEKSYVCPKLDNSTAFKIENGRHSVVELTVDTFVSNNCDLSDQNLWLLTGPNMAGKSTFLRQNALITILAQMGYFVPAKSAHIGLVDHIFTRIGASDDLASGQSTFMVEMVETAAILNGATEKSLVILDEIGRGTATYDGLSIAWACIEHLLIKNKSRGLFATHYHELTKLSENMERLKNYHITVKEWKGDIVFMHHVKKGAAPRSYGIHVGKLAGLPKDVITRAQNILEGLEKASKGKNVAAADDLPLFIAPAETTHTVIKKDKKISDMENKLLKINLDALSPREAQNLLYDLQIMAVSEK